MRGLALACRVFAWLSAFAISAPAAHARATQPEVQLSWRTPALAGCATQAEIEARIARISARRLVTRDAPHTHAIQAQLFSLGDGRYGAALQLLDAHGRTLATRQLFGQAPGCRELDVSSAVVIATLLDGLPAPARKRLWPELGFGAFGAVGSALEPQLYLGGGLELVVPLRVPVLFDASTYAPGEVLDAQGRGASMWSLHGGTAACPLFGRGVALFQLCAGVQLGVLRAAPVALDRAERKLAPLVMVGLEPKLLVRLLRGVFMRLSLAAEAMLVRPRFIWEIEGDGRRIAGGQAFVMLARFGFVHMAVSGH